MTKAAPPRVVALLPAWNSAEFIVPTLESLAAQTYGNLEILISDDASSDDTAEICGKFIESHSQFRLMRQRRRQGWIGNVNALLREAQGEYFFFAFHDDPLKPTYVSSLVDALENSPTAVLAFSDIELGRDVRSYRELEGITHRVERARRIIRKEGLWWIPNRGVFRAQAAGQVGGLRRHFAGEYSADWPWLLSLSFLGEFVRVPEALIRKVWRTEGVSMSWKGTPWQAAGVASACASVIARAGIPIAEQAVLYAELALRGTVGFISRAAPRYS